MNHKTDAAAIHDGKSWRLAFGGEVKDGLFRSPRTVLPPELVEEAAKAGVKRMMFLLSGDVQRIDGAIPRGASAERVVRELKSAISEATGVDQEDSLVAGMTIAWPGVRKPFTAAFSFEGDAAEDFHAALAAAGIGCAGFASLELAVLAAWPRCGKSREPLAFVSAGHSFIVPAPRGANPGPQTSPCGTRHYAADAANWLERFKRSAASIEKSKPLNVAVVDPDGEGICASLAGAGFADVRRVETGPLLLEAVKSAWSSRPNRPRGVEVPVANPWRPKRLFSNFWIAAASAAILLLPAGYWTVAKHLSGMRCERMAAEALALGPKVKAAKAELRRLESARAALAGEEAAERALVEMRRPMVAFVDVAYFFCKHSGDSVTVREISQSGASTTVTGTFSDPEDGVALDKAILDYAAGRNLAITENVSERTRGESDFTVNRFRIVFDCSKAGEE